jgi:hypothetical protein
MVAHTNQYDPWSIFFILLDVPFSHLQYGPRALIVLLLALAATGVSFHLSAAVPWTARGMARQQVPAAHRNVLRSTQ